jgi:Flp pilus assembly protein TadG
LLPPLIRRPRQRATPRSRERGVTMALVALAMVSIIAMAALSIDIGTLYQAKDEAQRAADAAALTAARVISISGITGDPTNATSSWQPTCGGASSAATLAATSVAQQNLISGVAVLTANVTVNYGAGKAGGASLDCSALGTDFGVNPTVTVTLKSAKLPIFFSRVFSLFGSNYSATTVSAIASAEVFNSSKSGSVASTIIPVQPRCVKPWIIPNIDPVNTGKAFVNNTDGSIVSPGVNQLGTGVIGETFNLEADCKARAGNCSATNMSNNPPILVGGLGGYLEYVPASVQGTPVAVPSCSNADAFQQATAGCDENTVYTCGTPGTNASATQADLNENPTGRRGDAATSIECLINQTVGPDTLDTTPFPFQIRAGLGNPLVQAGVVNSSNVVTTSDNIVTLPIYDGTALGAGNNPPVTIVGFLQVFINSVSNVGRPNVTVLNVSGCGNGLTTTVSSTPVYGTSPVPIRLITAP